MRNLKFKLLLLFIAISSIIVINSCKPNQAECQSCTTASDLVVKAKFSTELGNQEFPTDLWFVKQKQNYMYADAITPSNSKFTNLSNNLSSKLNLTIPTDEILLAYGIFLNGLLQNNLVIDKENINGLCFYTYKSNKLKIQVYKKNAQGEFKVITQLSSKVDAISINLIHSLNLNIIKPAGASTTYLITNNDKLELLDKVKNSYDELTPNIKRYLANYSGVSTNSATASSVYEEFNSEELMCFSPCATKGGPGCVRGKTSSSCKGGCITMLVVADVANRGTWSDDSLSMTVKPLRLYDIRDGILDNSDIGRRYIDDYYYLGDLLYSRIEPQDYLIALRRLPIIYAIFDKIKNGDANEVVYTNEIRDELINVVQHFKEITSDLDARNKMSQIIEDLNTYNNHTVSELRTLLGL